MCVVQDSVTIIQWCPGVSPLQHFICHFTNLFGDGGIVISADLITWKCSVKNLYTSGRFLVLTSLYVLHWQNPIPTRILVSESPCLRSALYIQVSWKSIRKGALKIAVKYTLVDFLLFSPLCRCAQKLGNVHCTFTQKQKMAINVTVWDLNANAVFKIFTWLFRDSFVRCRWVDTWQSGQFLLLLSWRTNGSATTSEN